MAMAQRRQAERKARRLFRACLVDGQLDDGRARTVAQRVLEAGRRDRLATLERFLHLVRLDRARHTARVESAVPLSKEVQAVVRTRLQRAYGDRTHVMFEERPSLLGGMRIAVGSDVFDGSVRAALATLERRFDPGIGS
jgi:F-type H+-transporting ATPase subunit delta